MTELCVMYPDAGIHEMTSLLFHEHKMVVLRYGYNLTMTPLIFLMPHINLIRSVMCEYFAIHKPHLIRQHKANCLQWCCFWTIRVNNIWTIDQHDKWLHFGLALHTCIELFSGYILWLKVWHSNHNPPLILSYYLETVAHFQCTFTCYCCHVKIKLTVDIQVIPMVTQSDPGMENFGIMM